METDQGAIHVHLRMSERQVSPHIQGSLPCTKDLFTCSTKSVAAGK